MATYFIACGGTGGHLYPGLAVAERLHKNGNRVRLFVSPKPIDQEILKAHPEFESTIVHLSGWPGIGLKLIPFLIRFYKAFIESGNLLKSEMPVGVLGMGGFSCVPLLLASSLRKIPTFIHESNVIPGKATILLSKWVDKVLIGFESCKTRLPGRKTEWTGTPVRSALHQPQRAEALRHWGIEDDKTIIGVMGGSQGATGVNRLVLGAIEMLPEIKNKVLFLHLTGSGAEEKVRASYEKNGWNAKVMPFCHEMEYIYGAADFVIARSGAATLTECAWFGLPAILIPYPYAAEDHQTYNAKEYTEQGGGLIVHEGTEGAVSQLANVIKDLTTDKQRRVRMKEIVIQNRIDDAVNNVVKELMHPYAK